MKENDIKYNKKPQNVVEKIEEIEKLCRKLGLFFDNSIPNKYKIIFYGKDGVENEFIFHTYNDVLFALKMSEKISVTKMLQKC